MAVSDVRAPIKRHPRATTALLSAVGYAAVAAAFLSPRAAALVPDLTLEQVNLLADAIAAVYGLTILTLSAGVHFIRRGEVRKHAAAMTTSFGLILLFLALYLPKVAGGGTKEFVGPPLVATVYLAMLAVHVLLSILAVPVVVHALVLGLTHTPRELRTATPHRTVGRIAAGSWLLSLVLGVVTYVLLNHVYDWEFVAAAALPA
jgi:putative membrane protein